LKLRKLLLGLAVTVMAAPGAQAQDLADPRSALRELGIDLRFRVSGFGAVPARGGASAESRFGAQGTVWLDLDLGKGAGLRGTSIHARFDQNLGRSFNGTGGALLPFNTTLAFPGSGPVAGDLSAAYVTQAIGDRFSLSVGKLNMVEKAQGMPLVGSGGMGGFLHLGLAAPASGVTPPYLFGAMASYRTDHAILSAMVYDPTSAVRRDPSRGLFRDGATLLGSVTVPVKIAGLQGYHGFKFVKSSAKGTDFAHLGEAFLPGPAQGAIRRKHGIWYAAYSVQQYLWQDAASPERGWGFFGQVAVSDGNPTFLDWSVLFGLAGSSPIPGREHDRFGIGLFRYSLSDALVKAVRPVLRLRDEQGIEAFYSFAVNPRMRLNLNVQHVRPTTAAARDATMWTVSTNVSF